MEIEAEVFKCPQCGTLKFRSSDRTRSAVVDPNCDDCAVPTVFGKSTDAVQPFVRMRRVGRGTVTIAVVQEVGA